MLGLGEQYDGLGGVQFLRVSLGATSVRLDALPFMVGPTSAPTQRGRRGSMLRLLDIDFFFLFRSVRAFSGQSNKGEFVGQSDPFWWP